MELHYYMEELSVYSSPLLHSEESLVPGSEPRFEPRSSLVAGRRATRNIQQSNSMENAQNEYTESIFKQKWEKGQLR
jgi:hypothetical protein